MGVEDSFFGSEFVVSFFDNDIPPNRVLAGDESTREFQRDVDSCCSFVVDDDEVMVESNDFAGDSTKELQNEVSRSLSRLSVVLLSVFDCEEDDGCSLMFACVCVCATIVLFVCNSSIDNKVNRNLISLSLSQFSVTQLFWLTMYLWRIDVMFTNIFAKSLSIDTL